MRSSRIAVFGLLSLVAIASLAVVAGAPPPLQLCGTCGAEDLGTTEPGTLEIHIDADGDSEWIEHVPVTESAAATYRDDPEALERAVDDAWPSRYQHITDDEDIDRRVALENGTVAVSYAVDDVARPGVRDAWLVDYFALETSNDRYRLAAERVTIHAPEGAAITNDPRHATVEGNTATWSSETASAPRFDRGTILTYGPSDALGTTTGYATIALENGPAALERGLVSGVGPAILLALAGVAVGRTDWARNAFDAARLERLLLAAGLLGALGALAVSVAVTGHPFSPAIGSLSALGIGYAALAAAARRGDGRHSTVGLAALAGLATLATGIVLWLLGGLQALVVVPFGLAAALFLPIGFAFERGSRPLGLLFLAAVAPIVAAVGGFLFVFTAPTGVGQFLVWITFGTWAIVAAGAGYPLAVLGRRLATER